LVFIEKNRKQFQSGICIPILIAASFTTANGRDDLNILQQINGKRKGGI
jgi:hypothetical protein